MCAISPKLAVSRPTAGSQAARLWSPSPATMMGCIEVSANRQAPSLGSVRLLRVVGPLVWLCDRRRVPRAGRHAPTQPGRTPACLAQMSAGRSCGRWRPRSGAAKRRRRPERTCRRHSSRSRRSSTATIAACPPLTSAALWRPECAVPTAARPVYRLSHTALQLPTGTMKAAAARACAPGQYTSRAVCCQKEKSG